MTNDKFNCDKCEHRPVCHFKPWGARGITEMCPHYKPELTYPEEVREMYSSFLDYCLDCHDHEKEWEIVDCFLDGIREKLPKLEHSEDGWELPSEKVRK